MSMMFMRESDVLHIAFVSERIVEGIAFHLVRLSGGKWRGEEE